MADAPLILTYHAVEPGPAPLCVDPELFGRHLDTIERSGAQTCTVRDLAAGIKRGGLPRRSVAITFDDGFESVVQNAIPMLLDRGMTATIFCVSGHLGGLNDWDSQPAGAPRRHLASANRLAEAARHGVEIGSHGVHHEPLGAVPAEVARREIQESHEALEAWGLGPVASFAYPYGSLPAGPVAQGVRDLYSAACVARLGVVKRPSYPHALPRVDAHYVRHLALLKLALQGRLGPYLTLRSAGAVVRRHMVRDYVLPDPSGKKNPGGGVS